MPILTHYNTIGTAISLTIRCANLGIIIVSNGIVPSFRLFFFFLKFTKELFENIHRGFAPSIIYSIIIQNILCVKYIYIKNSPANYFAGQFLFFY